MINRSGSDPRTRLNLIIAVNIFCWAIAIFVDPNAIVADMAGIAFLTTLAIYPWRSAHGPAGADSKG